MDLQAREKKVAEANIVRADCRPCDLAVQIVTMQPLVIERYGSGSAALIDLRGRTLCCPFCSQPMDGTLTRKSI